MMFVLFVGLAVISLLAMIAGFIWFITTSGRDPEAGGPGPDAAMMPGDPARRPVRAAFRGRSWHKERDAEISLNTLPQLWRSGQRRQVLPVLLLAGGWVGLFLFGGLALLVRLDNKIFGLAGLAAGAYIAYLFVSGMRQK